MINFENVSLNDPRVLIIGSSGSAAELIFLLKALPRMEFPQFVYLDNGFIPASSKKRLKDYEDVLPVEISFVTPEECQQNSFDLVLSLSTMFRTVAPQFFTKENQALINCGINPDFPIFSDTISFSIGFH